MRTTLTRRYGFTAVHVLARSDWPDDRNREVYGKCANPAGHGHDYGFEVSVSGRRDASGRVMPVADLDRSVRRAVLDRLDGRHLNRDVDEFSERVPTAENIARFIWDALARELPEGRLRRVRVLETRKNSVALEAQETP